MNKRFIEISSLILGAFIFALAINLFIIPNDLGEGGVTGLTIILYYLFQWSPGITNLIFNTFLLIIGYKFLDRTTVIYTIITVIFHSLFLHITHGWSIFSDQILLNAIFAGIFSGIGIGLIFQAGGTTAGSAILARITNKYLGWSISHGLLFFDLIVVFCSYFIFGAESVMLTIIMLYIATKVMDYFLEGLNSKKAVTIISKKSSEIANQVSSFLGRGITVLTGYGYYTKNSKEILYIIISKREIMELKKIVKATDKEAFVTIHDVRDVFGEGFLDLSKS